MLAVIVPIPEIVFIGLYTMGSFAGPLASVSRAIVGAFRVVVLPINVLAGFAMNFFRFFVFKRIVFI